MQPLPHIKAEMIETPSRPPLWRRMAVPLIVIALMAAGFSLGLHRYLTLEAIANNRLVFQEYTASHPIYALGLYMLVYAAAVALSFPGATVLTILGGLLFGWLAGGLASVFAATAGAVAVFEVARTSLGDVLARRAGPSLERLKSGFAADAFHYLLFLRLVPAFPFWLINIAPALLNVRLRTFFWATLFGIIPGTFAFSFLGQGLDSVIAAQDLQQKACLATKTMAECPMELSLKALVTPQLLVAFAVLGLVALIPVIIKRLRPHNEI